MDSGFWFGFLDKRDQYYADAQNIYKQYLDNKGLRLLVPFPTLYEVLGTRLVKQSKQCGLLYRIMRSPKVEFVYDDNYRVSAYNLMLKENEKGRTLSLVDMIIRLMIADRNLKKDALVTFNVGDFEDVCRKNGIQIIGK